MAKIYESGDILLKIDNLRKITFPFYKAGDDEAIGELGISRPLKHLSLIIYHKQFHERTEESYTNVAKCYNQFVNAHPQFRNYDLFLSQFNPNPKQRLKHNSPLQLYGIKKDLNSPINLIREETLEELNRQGLPYYSYYDSNCFMNITKGSKKLILSNEEIIKAFSKDYFKGYELYVTTPSLRDDGLGNIYKAFVGFPPHNKFLELYKEFNEENENSAICIPDIKVVIEDKSTKERYIAKENYQNRFVLIYEDSKNVNLDLSELKAPIKLIFPDNIDIKTLISTLKTVHNNNNDEAYIEFYNDELKRQKTFRGNANNLITELSKDNALVQSK